MFNKKTLIELPFVYTVNEFNLGDQTFFAAGSEREHPAYLIDPENNNTTKVADGPGGMMSLFPPFIGFEAGIYFHRKKNENWEAQKVISLPFAHRCEILTYKGENHLFIATVSRHKENPSDWSNPGELHHATIPDNESGHWPTEIILNNLFRNHGMAKSVIRNIEVICISGAEGIFAIQPGAKNKWEITQLFDHEVSEFSFFDLDNDGEYELVTIEPFHGNTLNIYKKNTPVWQLLYCSPLSFGHGLSVGKFQDRSVVVVGNRRDSGDLELHRIHSNSKIEKSIIESNVGSTQTKVMNYNGTDYILCSNQSKNEVALYY
jgi:hypothetical protein